MNGLKVTLYLAAATFTLATPEVSAQSVGAEQMHTEITRGGGHHGGHHGHHGGHHGHHGHHHHGHHGGHHGHHGHHHHGHHNHHHRHHGHHGHYWHHGGYYGHYGNYGYYGYPGWGYGLGLGLGLSNYEGLAPYYYTERENIIPYNYTETEYNEYPVEGVNGIYLPTEENNTIINRNRVTPIEGAHMQINHQEGSQTKIPNKK